MNKQEVISKLKSVIQEPAYNGYKRVEQRSLTYALELVEELGKVTVPQFVADWYEENKEGFENNVYDLCVQFNNDNEELNKEVWCWFDCPVNKPIETLVCYCSGFYHDKNSSSENQRFTAEEKRWEELGYWGNDLYDFEEVEGEDE